MKKTLYHGLTAGIFSALAAIVWDRLHFMALQADFSAVVNAGGIIGSSLVGTMLAAVGYHFFAKWVKGNTDLWFNLLFTLLTLASFMGPLTMRLPLSIESPELFVGLTIPMHIFPQFFWMATKPLFFKANGSTGNA